MKKIEKISKRWQKISLTDSEHVPVMCKEVVEYLEPSSKKVLVDCTLGMGGHVEELIKQMPEDGKIVAIDKDEESLHQARLRLRDLKDRIFFVHEDYRELDNVLDCLGFNKVDGFLFDLGTSLYQLSSFQRGFSFLKEGPLDMRMDRSISISAYDLVNNLSEKELDFIFKEYGQERWHRVIAQKVVEERKIYPIATTMKLASIVEDIVKRKQGKYRIHPATRIFQALRIAVNRELDSLKIGLEKAMHYLNEKGRICVIDFHSLEDKVVKEKFKQFHSEGIAEMLTRRPLKPSIKEGDSNLRSRSAKMRVVEKVETEVKV